MRSITQYRARANGVDGLRTTWPSINEQWLDASKNHFADFRHRALRHHAQGIAECEQVFGETITLSTGRKVPVRWVAEQHVQEDLGFIPTLADWLRQIDPLPWMSRGAPPEIKALELETEMPEEPTEDVER